MKIRALFLSTLVILGVASILALPVQAQGGLFSVFSKNGEDTQNQDQEREMEMRDTSVRKLDQARLRVCEAHQEAIQNRAGSLKGLVGEMTGKFDGIATKVEDYYINTVIAEGKTLDNYASLKSDIEDKKTVLNIDLTKSEADLPTFSCNGDNPKGDLNQFRLDMQQIKTDLHEYRQSIGNLIQALLVLEGGK